MFRSFNEIEKHIKKNNIRKVIALARAQDSNALEAVVDAKRRGVISAILIGDIPLIKKMLISMEEPVSDYELISCEDELQCAKKAVELVKIHRADIPMKGLMQTANFMRAILNKTEGILPIGALLSEATIFKFPSTNRMMIATDCAINIAPTLEEKVKITKNAVELAKALEIKQPKVAIISALESVNPKIPSSVEADALAKMEWKDCTVKGPFALDNAISEEAAQHKGINDEVAGKADILVLPDLCAGNILHKSLHFFAEYETAGTLCGTSTPVIMTSRTDSPNTKYNSILVAILQAKSI